MRKDFISVLLLLSLLLFFVFQQDKTVQVKQVQVGNSILDNIEIADTPALREQGLSGKPSIDADYAMLFVFEKPDIYYFWMKDMNFPIDIIWLDENLVVVGLEENATPASYPASFGPEAAAKYVLEVQAGIAKKESLKLGSRVIFGE